MRRHPKSSIMKVRGRVTLVSQPKLMRRVRHLG